MDMRTEGIETRKGAAPPKDTGGGLKLDPVKESLSHLESLCIAASDAATDFTEAVKATAEKSGIEPGVLKAFIKARASQKLEKKKASADQLSLLFEVIEG